MAPSDSLENRQPNIEPRHHLRETKRQLPPRRDAPHFRRMHIVHALLGVDACLSGHIGIGARLPVYQVNDLHGQPAMLIPEGVQRVKSKFFNIKVIRLELVYCANFSKNSAPSEGAGTDQGEMGKLRAITDIDIAVRIRFRKEVQGLDTHRLSGET